MFKRSAVAGTCLVISGLLAACSGGGSTPPGDTTQGAGESQAQPGPQISDPKDAAAAPGCDLLSAEALSGLGLDPGEIVPNDVQSGGPQGCSWDQEATGGNVSLMPITDRSIQQYYDSKSTFSDYQELTISGHPAVRANQGDPKMDGFCAMFLATKQDQLLYSFSDIDSDGNTDPCGLAQQALEASVPTLPSAK